MEILNKFLNSDLKIGNFCKTFNFNPKVFLKNAVIHSKQGKTIKESGTHNGNGSITS